MGMEGSLVAISWPSDRIVPKTSLGIVVDAKNCDYHIWSFINCVYVFTDKKLFDSYVVGLISAGLLSVNPLHVWLSSVPLTEMVSLTLVLIGVWAFVGYMIDAKAKYLLVAGIMLGFASGFRIESWFFSAILSLFLLINNIVIEKFTNRYVFLFMSSSWFFPLAWIVGNYLTTGDPLAFVKVIRAYKLQAYGQEVAYERYLSAFLHIDPYITLLGIGGIIACLKSRKRFLAKLAYVSVTLVPLGIFIGLHGGQLEPPGNYLRYLAPFLFFFYPALSYLLFVSVQVLNIAKLREYVLVGCLAVMITTQLTTTFQFTNDPSAYGLAVGEMIRQLRQANPEIADRPVMIELSYWEYLAIKVGANDIDTIMYDRDLDYRRHT